MIKTRRGFTGWYLPVEERNRLLTLFPPAYEHVVAHHITELFNVYEDTTAHDLSVMPQEARIVGVIDDHVGIQALVVSFSDNQPDLMRRKNDPGRIKSNGSWYHITWSHAEGRKPVESNNFCTPEFCEEIRGDSIVVTPRFFPFV